MLDSAGLKHVEIFASSSLDEYEIQKLVNSGAPIDVFGVGTKLAVMEGASHLDMAYKLVEYAGKGRLKLSSKKVLHPGRKQIFRQSENGRKGRMIGDIIGSFDETLSGEPLLCSVMLRGRPTGPIEIGESRQRLQGELLRLPATFERSTRRRPNTPSVSAKGCKATLSKPAAGLPGVSSNQVSASARSLLSINGTTESITMLLASTSAGTARCRCRESASPQVATASSIGPR